MEFASDDGTLKIVVPKGTTALDDKGAPLTSLKFAIDDIPLVPTEADIIGPVYNLEPDGATFDPPITLIWGYNPADVPSGIAEEDLILAYYDEDSNEWVKLSSEVNLANNVITASVDHFTDFAVIAAASPPTTPPPPSPTTAVPAAFTTSSLSISPLEINTGESVSISVLVTNTGEEQSSYTVTLKINEAIEETKEATLAGGASETVTFTTSQDEVDTYSVDVNGLPGSFVVKEALTPALPVEPEPAPPPSTFLSGINWLIYGPAIAVVIFLAIVLIVRRRRQIPFDW